MTSFKNYPYSSYDHKKPWYEWTREQITKKDAWKREIEKEIRKLLENYPKLPDDPNTADRINHSIECSEWLERAKKQVLGEEAEE